MNYDGWTHNPEPPIPADEGWRWLDNGNALWSKYSNGWEVIIEKIERPRCDQKTSTMEVGSCCCPPGHEGPHSYAQYGWSLRSLTKKSNARVAI